MKAPDQATSLPQCFPPSAQLVPLAFALTVWLHHSLELVAMNCVFLSQRRSGVCPNSPSLCIWVEVHTGSLSPPKSYASMYCLKMCNEVVECILVARVVLGFLLQMLLQYQPILICHYSIPLFKVSTTNPSVFKAMYHAIRTLLHQEFYSRGCYKLASPDAPYAPLWFTPFLPFFSYDWGIVTWCLAKYWRSENQRFPINVLHVSS